jgi:hypothetical protein
MKTTSAGVAGRDETTPSAMLCLLSMRGDAAVAIEEEGEEEGGTTTITTAPHRLDEMGAARTLSCKSPPGLPEGRDKAEVRMQMVRVPPRLATGDAIETPASRWMTRMVAMRADQVPEEEVQGGAAM